MAATVLATLKDLHLVLSELSDARKELQRAPLQLVARQADLTKKELAIKADREVAQKMRRAADEKELTLKIGEEKVQKLRIKLNQANSNKEFSAIQDEIKSIQAANDQLADEVLQAITDQEQKVSETETLEKQLVEARAEFAKLKEVIDYKVEKLTGRVTMLEQKGAEYESQLDDATRADYRRLSKMMGEGALAACADGICQACYTSQTPQSLNELIMGRVIFCKACGALLYRV